MRTISSVLRTTALFLTVWVAGAATTARADVGVGWIEINGPLLEQPEALTAAFGLKSGQTLRSVVNALHAAAARADVEAVVLRLRQPALTMSQVEELGEAVRDVRDAGKKVHLFTEIYGTAETALAAYVDDAMIQAGSTVSFPGLYTEEMYLADALRWLGVEPDFVQIGKYKGAEETYVNTAPSPPWDKNYSRLLDEMYAAMRTTIKNGRGMSDSRLDKAMERAFMATPEQAIKAGLIDAEVDRLDLTDHLKDIYHDEVRYITGLTPTTGGTLDMANPFALFQMLSNPARQHPTRATIAVLHIDGPIVDGESKQSSPLGGANVGALTIRKALKAIEDDPLVKGVVVRINSPGGSAIASESIWLGIRRVAEIKPVWVSVGSMAASGGYYIAVSGDRIYVNPSSIVGSIGVVGGKFALGGAYDKLHLHIVPRARGPHANMFSAVSPWSDEDRDLIRQRMTDTYNLFVDRVKSGRRGIDISKTAEGRLFAGESAIKMRLADRIGSLDDTLSDLAETLQLREGAYDVLDYPAPKTLDEIMQGFLGLGLAQAGGASNGSASLPGALAAKVAGLVGLLGPQAWAQARDALGAMMLLRKEPVLLVAPRILLFR